MQRVREPPHPSRVPDRQASTSLTTPLVTEGGGAGRTCTTEHLGTVGTDARLSFKHFQYYWGTANGISFWRVLKAFLPCSWNIQGIGTKVCSNNLLFLWGFKVRTPICSSHIRLFSLVSSVIRGIELRRAGDALVKVP